MTSLTRRCTTGWHGRGKGVLKVRERPTRFNAIFAASSPSAGEYLSHASHRRFGRIFSEGEMSAVRPDEAWVGARVRVRGGCEKAPPRGRVGTVAKALSRPGSLGSARAFRGRPVAALVAPRRSGRKGPYETAPVGATRLAREVGNGPWTRTAEVRPGFGDPDLARISLTLLRVKGPSIVEPVSGS